MVSKNCITLTTYLNHTDLYERLTLLQHYLTACVQSSNKHFFCRWLKLIFFLCSGSKDVKPQRRTIRHIKRANAYRRDKCHNIIWASSLLICLERRLRACVRDSSPVLTIRILSVHSISDCISILPRSIYNFFAQTINWPINTGKLR